MSAVDLSRVGACVLKHAVTGEVRPGRRTYPGALPIHMGRSGSPEGSPWVLMLGVGTAGGSQQDRRWGCES